MNVLGFKIGIGVVITALLFYFVGAKMPGLANKLLP